ncbi:MAG: type VI secretion system baseplate subunit TssF [Phycisphaerales bacterium]|nr:type VI secretion system baseplate subunit TssF [Phycisphaerales bacterium]
MDSRLLDYYDRELTYLKEMGKEFAAQYPGVADRLRIDDTDIRDPYVRHLIQAFAFLTARVSMRFDDEFPTICQNLLEAIYPGALAPTPWMAVVEFEPEPGAIDGSFTIERGRQLRVPSLAGRSDCMFTTAHDVVLRPIRVTEVRYIGRDVNTLGADLEQGARAALVIRIAAESGMINDLEIDHLRFYVNGSDETAARLYQQVLACALDPVIRRVGRKASDKLGIRVPVDLIRPVGFEPEHAVLPVQARAFDGHRLLAEYFMLPQRFHFFDVGLEPASRPDDRRAREKHDMLQQRFTAALAECTTPEFEIVIPLSRREESLESQVEADRLRLFAAPVVNLFARHANRIDLEKRRQEYPIDVDRMRATDYEVHTVLSVEGIGGSDEARRRYHPFFASHDDDRQGDADSFYTIRRRPRLITGKSRRSQDFDYHATDTCISIVDREHAPHDPDVRQLEVRAICTNSFLAAEVASRPDAVRFRLAEHAPVVGINRLASAARPRPSNIEGAAAWRFIGRLRLNYLSLTGEEQGGAVLRSTLRLFADPGDPNHERQIESVLALESTPIVRPVVESGRLAWARGVGIQLTLDEDGFRGTGHFALASVLDRFFAQYVSINSLTETTLCTKQSNQVRTWPARSGRRWTL